MLQEWTLGTGIFNPVVDLSNYAGQNIYIALRHFNCTDQFRLSIDDFTVREQAGANQVTINVGPNNPSYGTVAGAGIYTIGDSVTVSATASTGYTFSKWVDDNNTILSTNNPYTFVAAANLNLTAIFLDEIGTNYTITVNVNDSTMGTATGAGTYTAGDLVTLTATPFAGYNFVNWTQISGFGENVVGTDTNLIITVTGDKTFVANFEAAGTPVLDTLIVHVTVDDPTLGTINPVAGTYYVLANDTLMISATPNPGITFDGFRVYYNGELLSPIPAALNPFPCIASPVLLSLGEITVMAMFNDGTAAPDSLTFIVSTADATMGTTNPAPGTYHIAVGDTTIFTAVPNSGYEFLYWVESVSAAGMTIYDTLYGQSAMIAVTPMMAGMTLYVMAHFQVGGTAPCEAPTGLTVTGVTDESITITWDANPNVERWNIQYSVPGASILNTTSTTNSCTLSGLNPSTTYTIQVQADCGDGNESVWTSAWTATSMSP